MVEWSWCDSSLIWRPTGFLQCFDTVGLVIWPVKIVPEMTYNVSSETLSLYTTTTTVLLEMCGSILSATRPVPVVDDRPAPKMSTPDYIVGLIWDTVYISFTEHGVLFPPLPFPPLEVGPIKSSYGVWGKLQQRGLGWSPSRQTIWCILALIYDIWRQKF